MLAHLKISKTKKQKDKYFTWERDWSTEWEHQKKERKAPKMLQVKWWKWRGQAFRPIFLNSCSSATHGTNSTRQRGGRWSRGRESRRRLSRFLRLTSAGGQRSSQSCFLTCTWWITSVWCWKGIYTHGILIWCTDWIYFCKLSFHIMCLVKYLYFFIK